MYTPDSTIIDNNTAKLFEELRKILAEQKSLDIASGYFNIGGFQLVKDAIKSVERLRLLIGKTPEFDDRRKPDLFPARADEYALSMREDLEKEPYKREGTDATRELIEFLQRDAVEVRIYEKGFLHGKAYIFDKLVILGSSNFTYSGLTANTELNAVEQEPQAKHIRAEWFERFWKDSRDFKADLLSLLRESKFGTKEYMPYQVFIKSLYDLQREDIEGEYIDRSDAPDSAVDLTTFQEDAVKRIFSRLRLYNGAMVADSVGLGKTWIAKKIVEEFGFYQRKKFIVVCPAQLHNMWANELRDINLSEFIIHQEMIGREDLDVREHLKRRNINPAKVGLIVVDESHNFRNPGSNRFEKLFTLIEQCRSNGNVPKVLLLTATPVNNTIWDLYHQISLISQNNTKIFLKEGIFDVAKEFRMADKSMDGDRINDVMQLIAIRRTRQYIRENYPDAQFRNAETGQMEPIRFPERDLDEINYSLDATYAGLYRNIAERIQKDLTLAYYNRENYKVAGKRDQGEVQKMQALAGIFQTVLLKRLESSVEAFRSSIRNQITFLRHFTDIFFSQSKLLRKDAFNKLLQYFEDEEASEISMQELQRRLDARVEGISLEDYQQEQFRADIEKDMAIFEGMLKAIKDITVEKDAKLNTFKEKLLELKGEGKILVFSYYTDTVRYVVDSLKNDGAFMKKFGGDIERMDGSFTPKQREDAVDRFLHKNTKLLMSTDVLSEGQNLQKAKIMINYDLHWNPTRIIQRAGRIDRIGSPFERIKIFNFYPESELEDLLELVKVLQDKIRAIDQSIGLDASVMGETINPKVFGVINALRGGDEATEEAKDRLKEETLRELEEETFGGGESFWQPLKDYAKKNAFEQISSLPLGIQSGLKKGKMRGVFFYHRYLDDFHFWHLYDVATKKLITNKTHILHFISCKEQEPRFLPEDIDSYAINEKVTDDIREIFENTQAAKIHVSVAGKKEKFITDMQKALNAIALNYLAEQNTEVEKDIDEILKKLNEINFTRRRLRELRAIWRKYRESGDNWRRFVAGLKNFLADKQVLEEEDIGPFDPAHLTLITVQYVS